MACRVQSRTSPFEPRQPDPGAVRGKASDVLGRRAHRLASARPRADRRAATRSDLGSKTPQFFGHPQKHLKGGRKNLGLRNEPQCEQTLTYEWDTKRGKTTPSTE